MFKKILILMLFIGVFYGVSYYEHNYIKKDCTVVQSNNGMTTICDSLGHYWDYSDDSLKVGDCVKLKMFDNLTDTNAEDDIIIKVIK